MPIRDFKAFWVTQLKMLDAARIERLGSLIAIGVATQVSQELMQTDNSAHSFWLLVALSLIMIAIQTLYGASRSLVGYLKKAGNKNWIPWVTVISQTFLGLETVVWTLYGNAVGIWVLRLYLDLYSTPLFFYFLPIWFFGKSWHIPMLKFCRGSHSPLLASISIFLFYSRHRHGRLILSLF